MYPPLSADVMKRHADWGTDVVKKGFPLDAVQRLDLNCGREKLHGFGQRNGVRFVARRAATRRPEVTTALWSLRPSSMLCSGRSQPRPMTRGTCRAARRSTSRRTRCGTARISTSSTTARRAWRLRSRGIVTTRALILAPLPSSRIDVNWTSHGRQSRADCGALIQ